MVHSSHVRAVPQRRNFPRSRSNFRMSATDHKWVYLFREGAESMRNSLGGKGAGSAEMTRAGIPVPPGFTITTEACLAYFETGQEFPPGLQPQLIARSPTWRRKPGSASAIPPTRCWSPSVPALACPCPE